MTLKLAPVTVLETVTSLNIPTQRVLQGALDAELLSAIVIGYDKGGEFYFASTQADGGDVLWLMELAKFKLMGIAS